MGWMRVMLGLSFMLSRMIFEFFFGSPEERRRKKRRKKGTYGGSELGYIWKCIS